MSLESLLLLVVKIAILYIVVSFIINWVMSLNGSPRGPWPNSTPAVALPSLGTVLVIVLLLWFLGHSHTGSSVVF